MTDILIVDDHAIVRKGLVQLLEEEFGSGIRCDEAANGNDTMQKVSHNTYDLVLLDISLPGRSGTDVLRLLKQEKPDLPVMIISMYPEEQYAVRALKCGAAGYLTKESAPDELIAGVKKVLQGGRYVSNSLAELLAAELTGDSERRLHPHTHLSHREFQIACMIASGRTVSAIASELCLSVKTISTYRTRLLTKMQMKSNAELTSFFIRQGLV